MAGGDGWLVQLFGYQDGGLFQGERVEIEIEQVKSDGIRLPTSLAERKRRSGPLAACQPLD
ncbi:unnamed protein product [Linum tenue]|uniref:Uncharacterized protein n=1 Tax=Linum tenue TaxID=586396 RepID=A0AAV0Q2V9_9ROSI|nr:unnamed protein product [Linum tenue]